MPERCYDPRQESREEKRMKRLMSIVVACVALAQQRQHWNGHPVELGVAWTLKKPGPR